MNAGIQAPPPVTDTPPPPPIRFLSLAELHAATPENPAWVWDGYIAEGTTVLVAGKPKAGKTSLVFGLVRAMCNGVPDFLGRPIAKDCPIVYVSEEGASTLKSKLPPHGDIRILTRENAYPQPTWPELIEAATQEAIDSGARLIIVDTLRKWARFKSEGEKDASTMQAVLASLDAATNAGIAVLLIHHQRKAEGDHGDAVAGTNALTGAVDVVLEIERMTDVPSAHRQRVLTADGRWEQTPGALVFEKHADDSDYDVRAVGDSRSEAVSATLAERILEYVAEVGEPKAGDIKAHMGGREQATVDALAHLVHQEQLQVRMVGSAKMYSLPTSTGAPAI